MARAGNLSQQIATLGRALPRHVQNRWNNGYKRMCEDMAAKLEALVTHEVFERQAEPSGKSWEPISPLTVAIRAAAQKRAHMSVGRKLGGEILPRSFRKGGRGYHLGIRVRYGFVYGSKLRAGRHLVGRTFAERFKMPKSVVVPPGGGKSARYYKAKLRAKRSAADRIRGFMLAVTGIPAPGRGKQLTHPARPIIYWTPKWERACLAIAVRAAQAAWAASKHDITNELNAVRQREIAMHRTSRVG